MSKAMDLVFNTGEFLVRFNGIFIGRLMRIRGEESMEIDGIHLENVVTKNTDLNHALYIFGYGD